MAKLFNEEQERFIRDNLVGVGNADLANMINKLYCLEITRNQIKSYKKNHKLSSGLTGRFEQGHVPANKGKHQAITGNMGKTMFKHGHRPHNYDPIGTEKIKTDGYVWIKISNTGQFHKRWKQKHRLIWEKENGPIPKDHRILFADGNNRNFDLNNLVLVTQSEMARLNQGGYIYPDADMTKTMLNVVKIRNKILKINK